MTWTLPTMAAPPQLPPDSSSDVPEMLGLLRQVRAGAQYLDRVFAGLEEMLGLASEAKRIATIQEEAAETAARFEQGVKTTADYLAKATFLLERSAFLRDWFGDDVTDVELAVADASRVAAAARDALLKVTKDRKPDLGDGLIGDVREARKALHDVVVLTAAVTIPWRLNQHLDQTNVGRTLSFATLFEDELPNEADRAAVLKRLADSPAQLHGVIELETGTIVRISPNVIRRRMSYVGELAALLGGGLAALLIIAGSRGWYFDTSFQFPFFHPVNAASAAGISSLTTLLLVFAAGAFFHFIVDLVKAQQGTIGAPRWLALDDWLLWMHARELKVIGSIAALWVVFGGLMALNTGALPDALTVFFAGYSFDSLADVVIKRFDTFAGPQVAKVEKAIAGTA